MLLLRGTMDTLWRKMKRREKKSIEHDVSLSLLSNQLLQFGFCTIETIPARGGEQTK
jgi:hypothetical protein